jgi:hypothetical protein
MEATAEVAVMVEGAMAAAMEASAAILAEAMEAMNTEGGITIITANLAGLAPLDTEVSGGSASGVLAIIGMVSTFILAAACLY